MPKKKTRRQLADEAFERTEAARVAGVFETNIPGQLNIDGSTFGANPADLPPKIEHVPDHCPECGRIQTYAAGWSVVVFPTGLARLECGNCGHPVIVDYAVADRLRRALRAYFDERAKALARPKRDPSTKRVRGAG